MTVPNAEPTVEQQHQHEKQQHEQQKQQKEQEYIKREYKKKPAITKHKRGGGNSHGRYRDESSRYSSSYKELPRYTVPSYVYYYPSTVYYPPSSTSTVSNTREDEDPEITMHKENMNNTSSVGPRRSSDQVRLDLKKQLEFYFSRQNLVNDTYLVSQMDSELYVPISLVANFRRVREWTNDIDTIVKTLRDSAAVTVDESGTKVKPNISVQRNTVIWRDVPECTEQEINDLLKDLNSPPVQSIKQDIGNMWYFTFESEDDALKLLLSVRGKSFKDQAIAARMKSEPFIRVQSRPSAASNVSPTIAKAEGINQGPSFQPFPLILDPTVLPYSNGDGNNVQYSYPTSYRNTTYPHNNKSRRNNNGYQNQSRLQQPSSARALQQNNNNHYHHNTNYYHEAGNGNRSSYEKNPQQLSGRSSSRGGFKSKYHFNNKSERFSSESAPNLEAGLASVSISDAVQHEKQYHYQPRQQNSKQLQSRHYNNNKYYSNNKNKLSSNITTSYHANEYQTQQQQHYNTTIPTTTNDDKKKQDVISTSTVEIEAELDQFTTTKQTIQDTTRKTAITYKSKKKVNHGNGNNSHNNEVNHMNNGGDKLKTEYHNSNRKKNKKSNTLVISSNNGERANENDQRAIELKPTHFPPLPNKDTKTINESTTNMTISNISDSSVGTTSPTRSAADIVKSNTNVHLKNRTELQYKLKQDEKKPVSDKTEAIPSLYQTTQLKPTSFSYADMLKKKENKQTVQQ